MFSKCCFDISLKVVHFHRLVNCEMKIGGPALDVETHKALCVLPLNSYNEIAFLAIWLWLCILALATVINIILITVTSCTPSFKAYIIKSGLSLKGKKCIVNLLIEANDVGSFFDLYLVKQNCDDLTFHEFVQCVGKD